MALIFDGSEMASKKKNLLLKSYGLNTEEIAVKTLAQRKKDDAQRIADTSSFTDETKFEKGQIAERLSYGYGSGSEPLKFTKTGKELKAQIPGLLSALNIKKAEILVKLGELSTAAGIVPNKEWFNDIISGLTVARYDWKQCDELCEAGNTAANDYNAWCYTLSDIVDDINALTVINANLKDDAKYTLSVSQLLALQFTN